MASQVKTDDFTCRCKAMFDQADEDKNGELSQTELTSIIHKLAQSLTDEDIDVIFQDLDKDKDKRLSWLEFTEVLNAVKRRTMKKCFNEMDKDNSGAISQDELRAGFTSMGFKLSEDELQTYMKEADKDGDSTICYKEFLEFWCKADIPK